ncbi:cytochrome P460 family protein [Chryseobacterium sp. ISL-6]|uniref:cytochrome P460 family protein n=1 Tax=Chryseobacterium sp. ISL-6 TaxID=2819143 RepID=UPI001BE5D449|nr:cytochrome P460 family protein [Chryseobacterium sp. ISL-6]MBT2620534.1 hypothetical protein [Chryseobacterium sp. ISL-6]
MKKNVIYLVLSFLFILSCHSEEKENLNRNASVKQSDELLENPLLMTPITSSVQPKDSTISTLYGNKAAAAYAKMNSDSKYPEGAVLYEVTWKQKPDELWFGANIPKEIFSVEKVIFQNRDLHKYEIYMGKPLKKKSLFKDEELSRISFITSQKMAVSP